MKMKLKTRKKQFLLVFTIICFLCVTIRSKALITTDVEYPQKIKQGETFEIKLFFYYEREGDCLYSERGNIWLYTAINDSSLTLDTTRRAIDYAADLRPVTVSFAINTTVRKYQAGDIFKFQIKYHAGSNISFPIAKTIISMGYGYTDVYEIAITEPRRISVSFIAVIIPFFVIATVMCLRKNRKGVI